MTWAQAPGGGQLLGPVRHPALQSNEQRQTGAKKRAQSDIQTRVQKDLRKMQHNGLAKINRI